MDRETIRHGDRGQLVLELQQGLNTIFGLDGDSRIAEGGFFDGDTEVWVKELQRDYGLDEDGVVGTATWEAFDDAVNELPSSPPDNPGPSPEPAPDDPGTEPAPQPDDPGDKYDDTSVDLELPKMPKYVWAIGFIVVVMVVGAFISLFTH
jgi:hypothetical protein